MVNDLVKLYELIIALQTMGVDGETMQFIIEQVGMKDQMLRQLVLSADDDHLTYLINEKELLERNS
jgi:hypothetical protein